MTEPYIISDEASVRTRSAAGLNFTVASGAAGQTTLEAAQTSPVNVSFGNPVAGNVMRASSTSAARWSNPILLQEEGVSLNAANFNTINFTGSIVTATDAGGGVCQVQVDASGLSGNIGVEVFSETYPLGTSVNAAVANTWLTRNLNTADAGGNLPGVALNNAGAGPGVVFSEGTYYVWGQAPAYRVDGHRSRLQQISGAGSPATAILGSTAFSKDNANAGQDGAFFYGVLTVPVGGAEYEIQHIIETRSNSGSRNNEFGRAAGDFGGVLANGTERYTIFSALKLDI